jgi:hypothetical protein
MTTLDLYVDINKQALVQGVTSGLVYKLPHFSAGDTYSFRIRALTKNTSPSAGSTIYSFVPNTGKTLTLTVGVITASGAITVFTNQATWGLNGDTTDPYFYADVPFNTAPILSAVSNESVVASKLEIKLVDGTPKRILFLDTAIDASLASGTSIPVPSVGTPATMEAVLALLNNIVCQSVTIQSSDFAHQERLWIDTDGTPHNDIT